jgi:hypothetical protein
MKDNSSLLQLYSKNVTMSNDYHESFYVIVYNAVAQITSEILSLPVSSSFEFNVKKSHSSEGWEHVESNLVTNYSNDGSPFILLFDSGTIEPISFTVFRIEAAQSSSGVSVAEKRKLSSQSSIPVDTKVYTIGNDAIQIHFEDG